MRIPFDPFTKRMDSDKPKRIHPKECLGFFATILLFLLVNENQLVRGLLLISEVRWCSGVDTPKILIKDNLCHRRSFTLDTTLHVFLFRTEYQRRV